MTRIVARFQKAGIEIAFPQCDVRVQMVEDPVLGDITTALNAEDRIVQSQSKRV